MSMITLTSSCKTNLSKTLSCESNNNINRDASFSSSLNSTAENFVRKLTVSNQNLSPGIASQEEQEYLGANKVEEEEIGVFSAEKYFNGAMDDSPRLPNVGARKHKCIKEEQIKVAPVKPKIQPGTPSVRSESSCNSQSALLQNVLRNPSRKQANKVQGKSFFAGLGCKCSCSDKDSVDVDEHIGETSFKKTANCSSVHEKAIIKEPIKRSQLVDKVNIDESSFAKEDLVLNKENCFSFRTANSTTGNLPIKVHYEQEEKEEILPRKSLEVFGFPVLEKSSKSSCFDRRLSMLSWDAAPRLEEFEFAATQGESYNDATSDASSDLFEIESLTGKANPFLARQGSDATSDCATPTACYAPSEASIEWSVVTASAADYSVMSDYEELKAPTTATSQVKTFSATSNDRARTIPETPKRLPSISLGCNSHKAVRVAGEAYRTNEKANHDARIHRMSESFTPVTRFQAEAELAGLHSRQRQPALAATHSLPRSHSPRPSHLLYIQ